MPYPFPGMDPYLESPQRWSEVHNRLMVAIADDLSSKLRPKYRVAIEKRLYWNSDSLENVLVGIPDIIMAKTESRLEPRGVATLTPIVKPLKISLEMPEEVQESYLEVREIATGQVVTVIELLSPKNKRPGEGRSAYDRKRQQILVSGTHFVEIDLLRSGTRQRLGQSLPEFQYYILRSRSDVRPSADLYLFTIREPIPAFPLPLPIGDAEPMIDLQTLLNDLYDRAGFDLEIDYQLAPTPKLSTADTDWVRSYFTQTAPLSRSLPLP